MIRESRMFPLARSRGPPTRPSAPGRARTRARGARRRRRLAGCGSTGYRRSRRACRSPERVRRRRGTRACAPCCRRRRAPSCSPRASPRSRPRRRGARSAARGGGRGRTEEELHPRVVGQRRHGRTLSSLPQQQVYAPGGCEALLGLRELGGRYGGAVEQVPLAASISVEPVTGEDLVRGRRAHRRSGARGPARGPGTRTRSASGSRRGRAPGVAGRAPSVGARGSGRLRRSRSAAAVVHRAGRRRRRRLRGLGGSTARVQRLPRSCSRPGGSDRRKRSVSRPQPICMLRPTRRSPRG